jgi:hypothetical protein
MASRFQVEKEFGKCADISNCLGLWGRKPQWLTAVEGRMKAHRIVGDRSQVLDIESLLQLLDAESFEGGIVAVDDNSW